MTSNEGVFALSKAAKERWMERLCAGSFAFMEAASLMKASGDPSKLQGLILEGKVLAFNYRGHQWFPKYQFVGEEIHPVMEQLLTIAREVAASDVDLALWMISNSSLFSKHDAPAAHLDDPTQVIEAAHLHFEALW